jgi:hypothetical protein
MVAKVVQVRYYFRDMLSSRKMGRPTLYKKGAMTAAQRQRRHRAKLRREKKAAEVLTMRARNAAPRNPRWDKYYLKRSEEDRLWSPWRAEWLNMRGRLDELPNAAMRRWQRRVYLRGHAQARRAADRERGARRIDVTLSGEDLDRYEEVKARLVELNRIMTERGLTDPDRVAPNGRRFFLRPHRLSDSEVIKAALLLASGALEDEERGR